MNMWDCLTPFQLTYETAKKYEVPVCGATWPFPASIWVKSESPEYYGVGQDPHWADTPAWQEAIEAWNEFSESIRQQRESIVTFSLLDMESHNAQRN
jgi:hypothetical protein